MYICIVVYTYIYIYIYTCNNSKHTTYTNQHTPTHKQHSYRKGLRPANDVIYHNEL